MSAHLLNDAEVVLESTFARLTHGGLADDICHDIPDFESLFHMQISANHNNIKDKTSKWCILGLRVLVSAIK